MFRRIELKERYGVTTPNEARVQELTNRYYRGLEVLQALDEPMTVDELAAKLELDAGEIHDRIAYLSTFDRVQRDGDKVRPVEQLNPYPTGKEGGHLAGERGSV